MLKFFKKMERTRNFILLIFAIVLVGSLVVLYAPTRDRQADLGRSTEIAAKVGPEKITVADVVAFQKQRSQGQPMTLPASFLLNGMIQNKLIRLEAEKLGVAATDAEVAEQIRKAFTPADGKPFDQERYEQVAVRQAGSVSAFEDEFRSLISQQKLAAYLTSGVSVSEEEVIEDYKRRNTKFDLSYVPVNTADLIESINPSDDELKEYFEKNKKSYYISSPQKKIRYLYLATAKVGEKLTISDEELKEAYDKLPEDKKHAGLNVQEIVLRVAKPEDRSQVLAKANGIIETLKKDGEIVSEEKFADVAQGQSENPATALKGGRVPGLVRENKNNPTDPYQRILNMKEGEVTEPLEFGTNFYILRRGKSTPKNFEEAKKELEVSRRNSKAYEANAALATKAAERLKEVKDVKKVAAEFAKEANMSESEMVKETAYVKPGDEIDQLGISQDFEQGIASLEKTDDVGEKISIPGGFAVPLLVDKKDPREAEFDEVKDQVVEAVKKKQADEQIETIAKRIAESVDSPGGISSAASKENLKSRDAKDFILGSPLGEGPSASTSELLEDAIYDLRKGEVTKKPIKVGDNWIIVGVKDRQEADMQGFAKERGQLIRAKLNEKRTRVFADYIAQVKQRMESNGEIKIFKDAIEKIDEATKQNQPQTPQLPQLPQQQIPIPPQG